MAKHHTYSIEFKRQVAQEYIAGETPACAGEASRSLPQSDPHRVAKYEAGTLEDDARAADLLREYEAKIAALERMVGEARALAEQIDEE